jgi:uncharacterized protein (DUF58 family)
MDPANPVQAIRPTGVLRDGLDRFLYFSYSASARVGFFFSRRIRPAGIALIFLLILATGLGVGHQRDSVYYIFSFLCALILIALPWAFLRSAKIQAKRELPRYATAGEPMKYIIEVTHTGRRKLRHAWLSETLPDPRPGLTNFKNLREPGEEERNLFDRSLAYYRWQWLISRRRIFSENSCPDSISLSPGASCRLNAELVPRRRGVIQLNDLRLLLPDPLGIVQRCRKVPAPVAIVTVLPRRFPLPTFEMPGNTRFQVGGDTNTNAIGNAGEFVGLRDYRPGDPLRQIHWKSWAKTRRAIVKELEDTFYPRYGLVLDTFPEDPHGAVFEETLSVAASFVSSLDRSDSLLDLMFIKDEAHIVTAGRGLARTEKLLEVLAGVEAEESADFAPLSRLVLQHRDVLTSCLVILCGWDESRANFLKSLQRGGIICAPIVIGTGPKPEGLPVHWLESGKVGTDLNKLPRHLQIES